MTRKRTWQKIRVKICYIKAKATICYIKKRKQRRNKIERKTKIHKFIPKIINRLIKWQIQNKTKCPLKGKICPWRRWQQSYLSILSSPPLQQHLRQKLQVLSKFLIESINDLHAHSSASLLPLISVKFFHQVSKP